MANEANEACLPNKQQKQDGHTTYFLPGAGHKTQDGQFLVFFPSPLKTSLQRGPTLYPKLEIKKLEFWSI